MNHTDIETVAVLNRSRETLNDSLREAVEQSVGESSLTLVDQQLLAAVIVAVRGGFQESWSRREELSTEFYAKYDAIADQARKAKVPSNFREIDRQQRVEKAVCSNCRIRPGFGPCPRCSGVGVLMVQRPGSDNSYVEDCPECEDGFAVCTVCNGTKESVQATVRYVNYKPFDTNHVVGTVAVDALRAAYLPPAFPPDELAYDLEGGNQSAYRGQQGATPRDFCGYRFDNAIKLARSFVRRVDAAPNFVLHELKTYALPFVLASYASSSRTYQMALFIGADGAPKYSVS